MSRLSRRYLGVAVFLALLIPLTLGLRSWQLSRLEQNIPAAQDDAVAEALEHIDSDFERMQGEMLDQARSLASAPVVVRGLRERMRGVASGREDLVRFFAEVDLLERGAAELYDLTPQLVAWKGFSMPLDTAPAALRFLEAFQTALVHDEAGREALVVWWPVRDGARVLGAVRVMRIARFEAPVQNQFLRDFSLADRWRRATRLPVEVEFGRPPPTQAPARGQFWMLQGADGTVLGRVFVQPPAPESIVSAYAQRYADVAVFWTTLLLFWLLGGLWWWYRSLRRPDGEPALTGLRFAVAAVAWWGLRYLLLTLDVPARWQRGKSPLAPLFDPTHLASSLGEGLMRSGGDLHITAIFAIIFALAFVDYTLGFRSAIEGHRRRLPGSSGTGGLLAFALIQAAAVLFVMGLVAVLAEVARHVVLDSTLDYFGRRDLIPEPLVLVVLASMILSTLSVILLAAGLNWVALRLSTRLGAKPLFTKAWWATALLAALLPLIALYGFFGMEERVPWSVAVAFLAVGFGSALHGLVRRGSALELLVLRTVLPGVFLVTVLLYPVLFTGLDARQRMQMVDAAESFAEGHDPRVLFGIEQLLMDARTATAVQTALAAEMPRPDRRTRLDSLAVALLHNSLLATLPAYETSMTLFNTGGVPVGRHYETSQHLDGAALDRADSVEFQILRQMYDESGAAGALVEPVTGRREPGRFQFEGVAPVIVGTDTAGWVMVRAEPQMLFRSATMPFPRVLLPAAPYDDLHASLSVAEFRSGVLIRSSGRDFGRYRLDADVQLQLGVQPDLWRRERVEERVYLTYYRRQEGLQRMDAMPVPAAAPSVVAVRVPAINIFDHLYYLLRLTVAGLLLGLPLYLFGLYLRRRAGLLPAPRVRYRDKVLNAFLAVGIISVGAVGIVGLQVVTGENERTIQSWLRQHLERVEEALAREARGDEMPYRVLERTRVDSLAARVGLDLNVYQGYRLVDSSRPQLVEERLIDRRLSVEAYKALFFDGYRFAHTTEQLGSFAYTAGFQALPDEQGQPRYVISLPTLPEQERLEEERARTVAYLFGALLLLVLVVMLTASLLANALARPMARLRSGLQAVARGRFERMQPVDSRDEIGELVETFNEMQEQLSDSRRRLAQQERQLAWREMARQVAHEIKNPLTPMKLSVQHLRRAFESDAEDPDRRGRFDQLFERITTTLIEQIDALARIANEFHSFARMPSRILEEIDLNLVAEEAVSLMQEETDVAIRLALAAEPLIVEADREELRRNYINLIKNAIQALPEDGTGRVEIRSAREYDDDGHAWGYTAVHDTGEGFASDVYDRIFEPYFSTKTSGTGLGLAIVKKSVEELHGDIGFDVEEGGTTFWIRLPLVD